MSKTESQPAETLSAHAAADCAGERVDQVAARLFPDYSRSRLTQWIREGRLLLDAQPVKPKQRLQGGERLQLTPDVSAHDDRVRAQAIALDIVFEDQALLVINKPAGLVVHPAAGNPDGTLQNALLHHDPSLERLPRAGIVHRLDKDTTGLLVVARSERAHKRLVAELQAREIHREYRALVSGVLVAGGEVDQPIGRHPTVRTRMAVVASGKPARTHYRVAERYRAHSYLKLKLESGRTHQIRVHMAHIHHPIVGDPVYAGRLKLPAGCTAALRDALQGFRRQALHARRLGLHHPESGEWLQWQAPLPDDMAALRQRMRDDAGA